MNARLEQRAKELPVACHLAGQRGSCRGADVRADLVQANAAGEFPNHLLPGGSDTYAAVTTAPVFRKLALTAYVSASVGWLGAVVAFLALAVAGLTSEDAQTVRAAYLALLINLFATIVLLLYTQTLDYFADVAAATSSSSGDLSRLRNTSPLLHAGLALLLLLVATTLAVYKPRGLTPYGQRKQRERPAPAAPRARVLWTPRA
ncbi:MAG TPA: hypothetical protein VG144_10125 [Gaiellaceae bacterium]|nr:hypothetical protein [Gaiellaceae bacterium]